MAKEELYNKINEFCNETDWSKYPTYEHALEEFIKGIVAEETKELEKENALLKGRNEGFEQQIMGLLIKYEEVYKRFPDLKSAMDKAQIILKENAELKKKLEEADNATDCFNKQEEIISKAKELLKFWINDFYDGFNSSIRYEERHKALEQSEQFLNEVEK